MSTATQLTAAELSAGYAAGRFSPTEITRDLLEQVARVNPALNALYIVDEEGALAAAESSTRRWVSGVALSPLDGVPTTIKDALPSVGQVSYRGSAAHAADRQVFDSDAPSVARMREAGMVFLGKTTMPDFGILASGYSSKHGITRNPWNLTRTTGGSSSGAAATIAGGINPVAVGTDIVGSIRLPASFTGIFGFKPSQGRVPYYFPNNPSLVAGPMARTVTDAALLMNVIAEPDSRDFTALPFDEADYVAATETSLGRCRIAVVTDLGFGFAPDEDVVNAVQRAVRILEQAGHVLVPRNVENSQDDLREAERFYKVRCRAELSGMPAERRPLADVIERWSSEAESMSATEFYQAFNRLQRLRERAARLIHDCDFLILPSVPRPAFPAEQPGFGPEDLFSPWTNTFLFNLTEQPASSVPCGLSREGLPIGLQIVGRRFEDQRLFAMSRLCEKLLPGTTPSINAIIERVSMSERTEA